jgi:hypothetical protein
MTFPQGNSQSDLCAFSDSKKAKPLKTGLGRILIGDNHEQDGDSISNSNVSVFDGHNGGCDCRHAGIKLDSRGNRKVFRISGRRICD